MTSLDTHRQIRSYPALSMIPAEDREAFVTACGIQKAIYQQKLAAIFGRAARDQRLCEGGLKVLNVYFTDLNEQCDACKENGNADAPLIVFAVTGKSRMDKQFIALHEKCLGKRIAKATKQYAEYRREQEAK